MRKLMPFFIAILFVGNLFAQGQNIIIEDEYWTLSSNDPIYTHYSYRFYKNGTYINEYIHIVEQIKIVQYGYYFINNNKLFLEIERREPIEINGEYTVIIEIIDFSENKIKIRYFLDNNYIIEMDRTIY
jgi:hypothetical protein